MRRSWPFEAPAQVSGSLTWEASERMSQSFPSRAICPTASSTAAQSPAPCATLPSVGPISPCCYSLPPALMPPLREWTFLMRPFMRSCPGRTLSALSGSISAQWTTPLTPSTSGRSPERYSILRISNRILGCKDPLGTKPQGIHS